LHAARSDKGEHHSRESQQKNLLFSSIFPMLEPSTGKIFDLNPSLSLSDFGFALGVHKTKTYDEAVLHDGHSLPLNNASFPLLMYAHRQPEVLHCKHQTRTRLEGVTTDGVSDGAATSKTEYCTRCCCLLT
jgi:hypothetical protein